MDGVGGVSGSPSRATLDDSAEISVESPGTINSGNSSGVIDSGDHSGNVKIALGGGDQNTPGDSPATPTNVPRKRKCTLFPPEHWAEYERKCPKEMRLGTPTSPLAGSSLLTLSMKIDDLMECLRVNTNTTTKAGDIDLAAGSIQAKVDELLVYLDKKAHDLQIERLQVNTDAAAKTEDLGIVAGSIRAKVDELLVHLDKKAVNNDNDDKIDEILGLLETMYEDNLGFIARITDQQHQIFRIQRSISELKHTVCVPCMLHSYILSCVNSNG